MLSLPSAAAIAHGVLMVVLGPSAHAQTLQWERVPADEAPSSHLPPTSVAANVEGNVSDEGALVWERGGLSDQSSLIAEENSWEEVPPGEVIDTTESATTSRQAPPPPLPPAETTYGGFRDLYRGGRWYPSISTIVPMGFGPKGLMAGIGLNGSDCTPELTGCSRFPNISSESISEVGEAVLDTYIGFGDPSKIIGILISNITQNTIRSGERGEFLNGNQTGIAINRNLGPNTAVRVGAEGLVRWGGSRNLAADRPKSAYGVISHRIPLKPPRSLLQYGEATRWFTNLYLTAGAGNGYFRPLDEVVNAQVRAIKDAGCFPTERCSRERTRDAALRGTEWGVFRPIGAIALAITDQANFITEWTGRNLNVSLSLQPVAEWGWTITPGIGQLIQNADYGKGFNVPELPGFDPVEITTSRPILYLRSIINIRF